MSETTDKNVARDPNADIDAQVERELAQALDGQSLEQLMESAAPGQSLTQEPQAAEPKGQEPGKRIEFQLKRGRISAIGDDEVFVELAGMDAKNQGVVPLAQFDRPPRVGSIMDFVVERIDEAEGVIILSREGAISRATWEQLQRGAVVEARVVAHNKGGLEMEMVGGIRGFMPASQIDTQHTTDMESLVGQKLPAVVQEIDRKSKKVVLSRRKYLEIERQRLEQKVWEGLEVGQTREGKVRSIVEFGAFVDLGGADGLLHISDMSYTRIKKPTEVVKVGDAVQVKVLKLDREAKRISLGLKQVTPDPWEGLDTRYQVGEDVSGRVLRTADFGAFIEVEPGVEGLLPLSELSWKRVNHPKEVLKEGDVVRVRVLLVDAEKRHLTLSLKQSQGDPWRDAAARYPRSALVDATVVRIVDFGAFAEIEEGIEGLVHISELADRRVNRVDEIVKVGDRLQFRVLEVDTDNRRIRLSLKAAKEGAVLPPEPAAAAKKTVRKFKGPLKGGLE